MVLSLLHAICGCLTPGSRQISTCNFEYPVLWASGQLFGKSRKEALCNESAAAVEQCPASSTKAPSDDNGHGCLFAKVHFVQDSVEVIEYSKIMLFISPNAACFLMFVNVITHINSTVTLLVCTAVSSEAWATRQDRKGSFDI